MFYRVITWLALWVAVWALRKITPVSLHIVAKHKRRKMADVIEGGVFKFSVVAKNAAGRVVVDTLPITVTDSAGLGTVDSAAGTFTAGGVDGATNLVATDGVLTSAPYPITVIADPTPASLEIVPA